MWKVESADAPGVDAMILGVREMVSSATISSSSIILRKVEDNGGGDRWGVALRRKLRIVFTNAGLGGSFRLSLKSRYPS